jgi:hypothetical protein
MKTRVCYYLEYWTSRLGGVWWPEAEFTAGGFNRDGTVVDEDCVIRKARDWMRLEAEHRREYRLVKDDGTIIQVPTDAGAEGAWT